MQKKTVTGWTYRQMKNNSLGLFVFALVCLAASTRAQNPTEVFVPAATPVADGGRASLWLNVLNPSTAEIAWTFPAQIECRLVSAKFTAPGLLELRQPMETNQVAIGPGAFNRREYALLIPAEFTDDVMVEFPRRSASKILLSLPTAGSAELPATTKNENSVSLLEFLQQGGMDAPGRPYDPVQFFKEHVSGYEPMYIVGGPRAPGVKFQLSFKYQILNSYGWLAQHAPLLKGFHFGYTQTTLWDFNGPSSPFYDTSYKPEIMYLWNHAVGGKPLDWFRLDLQTGLQHESNGKGGADSRDLDIAYLRPTLTFGHDDGFQLALQPRGWVYVINVSENNDDIAEYRGYGDLRATVGWRRGLQVSALGRMGAHGNHESVEVDVTYPLMRLLSNSFTVYLTAQYFTGYGESFLAYNEKSTAYRVGLSLYR